MTKDKFVSERTRIISNMLDNPDKYGIYPTGICYAELDLLFEKIYSDLHREEKRPLREEEKEDAGTN